MHGKYIRHCSMNISRIQSCISVFHGQCNATCNASAVSRSKPNSWTTAVNVHLFLMRKLPPVLHGAITATVILASATRERAPQRSRYHYFCAQKSKGWLIIFGSVCHAECPSFVSHGKRTTSLKWATYSSGVFPLLSVKMQAHVNKATVCNSKSNTSVFAAKTPHCYLVALMNRTVMTSSRPFTVKCPLSWLPVCVCVDVTTTASRYWYCYLLFSIVAKLEGKHVALLHGNTAQVAPVYSAQLWKYTFLFSNLSINMFNYQMLDVRQNHFHNF